MTAGAHTPDTALDALFPLTVRCSAEGALLDATGDRALLPGGDRRAAWLAELLGPVPAGGAGPVAVGALDPPVDGIAERTEDGTLVLRLRRLGDVPGARKAARQLALYEAVLRTGPVLVHVHDREMHSLWASSQLRPELGYDGAPRSGEENLSHVHPEDLDLALEGRRLQLASGDMALRRRFRVRAADGDWRWLLSVAVDLEEDPAVGGVVVHALDITEEVHREQEVLEGRRRLDAVIDALEEAVFVVSDGRIAFANAAAAALLGADLAVDDLVGLPADEALRRGAARLQRPGEFTAATRDVIARGERVDGLRLETVDGRILEQHLRPVPVADREADRVWIVRDVTARVREEERRGRVLELERLARQAAERRNASLQQLDRLKTEFVASVSHELRTPLAALVSYLELLADDAGAPLSHEQRGLVEAAGRTTTRLRRLVDDLLVLAELQSGAIEIRTEDVRVPALLEEVAAEMRAGRPEAGDIRVELEDGPPIASDRLRISQIVQNLLDNALKYGPPGAPVRCRAVAVGGAWIIEIQDEGPGIPDDERERVLRPFTRGRRAAEVDVPGSGLGLALCSELVRRLHGTLELGRAPEGGTVARLRLPFEAEAAA